MSDKTEQPTPRRLRKARERGDGPVSNALVANAGFLLPLLLAPAVAGATAERAAAMVRSAGSATEPFVAARKLVFDVAILSLPIAVAAAIGAAAAGLLQTQGHVSGERLGMRLDRLDPSEGIKNLFRGERLFAVARALFAAFFVAFLSWLVFRDHAADLARSAGNELAVAPLVRTLAEKIAWGTAFAGLVVGGIDALVTFRAWRERHKMSRDEVRREHREAEGDPAIKAQRRRAHQEVLTGSILNAVRDATVVVINPTHLASALRYREEEDEAPRVVAQGQGELARRIVEAARLLRLLRLVRGGAPLRRSLRPARPRGACALGARARRRDPRSALRGGRRDPAGARGAGRPGPARRALNRAHSTRTRFLIALSSSSTSGRGAAPGAGA